MVHVSRYDLNVSLSLCSDITTPSHFYSSRNEHTGNVDEIIPLTFQDKIRSMCSKIIKKKYTSMYQTYYLLFLADDLSSVAKSSWESRCSHSLLHSRSLCHFWTGPLQAKFRWIHSVWVLRCDDYFCCSDWKPTFRLNDHKMRYIYTVAL